MLLIGFKRTSCGGTYQGIEGLEGFSMAGTDITLIKEGTKEQLEKYVKDKRIEAVKARQKLDKLQTRLEWDNHASVEYERQSLKYRSAIAITQFDTLLILEGLIIK